MSAEPVTAARGVVRQDAKERRARRSSTRRWRAGPVAGGLPTRPRAALAGAARRGRARTSAISPRALLAAALLLVRLALARALAPPGTMRTRRVQDAAPAPDCGQHEPLGGIAGALWGDSSAPAEPARGAASKEQEWVALDKGLRNAGKPPASAFRIPELGEEVELASVPASITREQFWWVMTKWMEGGESYIRSVWRTQELRQGDPELGQDEWTWAAKFRPRARTQVAQDGGGSGEQGGSVPGGVGRDGASGLAGEGAAAAARARLGGPEVGAPLSPAAAAAEVTTLWASLVAGAWHRAAQAAVAKPQAQPDQGVLASADGHGEAQHAPHVAAPLHTLRRMWRKDVITAPYLDEWCSVYREGCGEQGVSFTPVLPAWVEEESFRKPVMSYLPYNYPKSLRYAFYFVPPQNPSARPHLRMTAHLFDKGSQEFLATTAQRLLTKLDKWGRCVSGAGETATTSYQKRVEHDSLVEVRFQHLASARLFCHSLGGVIRPVCPPPPHAIMVR